MPNQISGRISALAEAFRLFETALQAPRTVLVVDDEESARRFFSRVLSGAGYATLEAADGPDALRVAEAHPTIDLVVTDVMMPEMSGCELARRLRHNNPDLKVLYVTGYSDRLFEEKVMMWENEAFVEKPCGVKALLEAVSLLWSQHTDTTVPAYEPGGGPRRMAS